MSDCIAVAVMTSTSNELDSHSTLLQNASQYAVVERSLSFDEYFESTAEYYVLLTLHRTVPPALVTFNCLGSAFTLAFFHAVRMGSVDLAILLPSCMSELWSSLWFISSKGTAHWRSKRQDRNEEVSRSSALRSGVPFLCYSHEELWVLFFTKKPEMSFFSLHIRPN